MAITAIPVTVKVFDEMGLLQSRLGQTVVAAAIFDDIIGLFLLAILLGRGRDRPHPDFAALALLLGKVAVFFAVTVGLGVHVYPRVRAGIGALQAASIEFSALMGIALAYGLLAEAARHALDHGCLHGRAVLRAGPRSARRSTTT